MITYIVAIILIGAALAMMFVGGAAVITFTGLFFKGVKSIFTLTPEEKEQRRIDHAEFKQKLDKDLRKQDEKIQGSFDRFNSKMEARTIAMRERNRRQKAAISKWFSRKKSVN